MGSHPDRTGTAPQQLRHGLGVQPCDHAQHDHLSLKWQGGYKRDRPLGGQVVQREISTCWPPPPAQATGATARADPDDPTAGAPAPERGRRTLAELTAARPEPLHRTRDRAALSQARRQAGVTPPGMVAVLLSWLLGKCG